MSTRSWLATGVVVLCVLGAAGIWKATRTTSTTTSVAVVLQSEDVDWQRQQSSGTLPNGCVGINHAQSVRAGTNATITDGNGDVLDEQVLGAPSFATGGDGVHCYVNYKATLPSGKDAYLLTIDGLPVGRFTARQLEAARTPDVFAGLSLVLSDCDTVCTAQT